jgi:hypothetical protein
VLDTGAGPIEKPARSRPASWSANDVCMSVSSDWRDAGAAIADCASESPSGPARRRRPAPQGKPLRRAGAGRRWPKAAPTRARRSRVAGAAGWSRASLAKAHGPQAASPLDQFRRRMEASAAKLSEDQAARLR